MKIVRIKINVYQINEASDIEFKTLFQFQDVSNHDLQVFVWPNARDTNEQYFWNLIKQWFLTF